ncbi:DegT/DnrJ/EryC1/StrS family aminotransferase [Lacibacterium aquatile]|uniref:DegT/DnrJ/EryC1/StrS family aminotransferase n=1 Tax=Lacibacterium aquatile TaxID=1168082 RepID=A0ABW5DRU4_9PROT
MTSLPARPAEPIAFVDLKAQRRRLGSAVDQAILAVVDHGGYISGPEVTQLESELARWGDSKHVISCASGTDALIMVLMAKGVKAGDAVFCPSFTFAATTEAIALVGATPVYCEVSADDFNMTVESLKAAIPVAKAAGLNPVGIIPVDLFGQAADYPAINAIAAENGMWVMADAAQSFGARLDNRPIGALADVTTTSFFPAKPLGCYGDGGAIFCDDDELALLLKSIRVHGQSPADKYENVRLGLTARLDTMQAAVLIEKLRIFESEIEARDAVAERYHAALADLTQVPRLVQGRTSVWAQYTIQVKNRDAVQAALKDVGVPTMVYYSRPQHTQPPYQYGLVSTTGLAVTERLSKECLSLPMHPYLATDVQDYIIAATRQAILANR